MMEVSLVSWATSDRYGGVAGGSILADDVAGAMLRQRLWRRPVTLCGLRGRDNGRRARRGCEAALPWRNRDRAHIRAGSHAMEDKLTASPPLCPVREEEPGEVDSPPLPRRPVRAISDALASSIPAPQAPRRQSAMGSSCDSFWCIGATSRYANSCSSAGSTSPHRRRLPFAAPLPRHSQGQPSHPATRHRPNEGH
jgi:hypothetical protein